MVEYNKIATVFNRDTNGTKKLIENDFRNSTVNYLKNNEWVFTEKIDGTNIRVHWDGHKVEFNGRTDRAQIPSRLVTRLNELFMTNETEEMFEQIFGEKDVILFGEGYGAGIQKGGEYRDDVDFILFDVMINNVYVSRDIVENIAKSFGIDIVPILFIGTIDDAVTFVKSHPKSTIGTANMEGVVGRTKEELYDRYGNRMIIKIKVCDFDC